MHSVLRREVDQGFITIAHDIVDLLKFAFYEEAAELAAINISSKRIDNVSDLVLSAIREGRISLDREALLITGQFDARLSRELSKIGTYDPHAKVYRIASVIDIPTDVELAAQEAKAQGQRIYERLSKAIEDFEDKIDEGLADTFFLPETKRIDKAITSELNQFAVTPRITPGVAEQLEEEYNSNLKLAIKGWSQEETARLRDLLSKYAMKGYRRDYLADMIQNEWGVSLRKAQFWAANETSLFVSKLRHARWKDSGIRKYRWSATGGKEGDGRTRERHKELHGDVYEWDNPPVVNPHTGFRGHPGEDYNCRCTAVPII